MPRRRLQAPIAALLFVGAILTGGSEFRGCESGERPATGGSLPTTTEGCLVDSDCVSEDMCVAMICEMRECVEAGLAIDADGDRYGPDPCGEDCNDLDPTVFPMATELCDGIDQDCDGTIDEGATGIRSVSLENGMQLARLIAGADDFVVLGVRPDGATSSLVGQRVARDGTESPVQTVQPGLAPVITALAVTPAGSGDLLVVLASDGGRPQRLLLAPDLGVLEGPTDVGVDVGVSALDVLVHSGREHVLLDVDGPPARRVLLSTGLPMRELTTGVSPPVLATDGSLLALTEGTRTVGFYDPVTGDRAGGQDLPEAFADRGLASGEGVVYAAYRDSFDHAITQVTLDSVGAATSAPSGSASDRIAIFEAGAQLAVTRRGVDGVSLSLLNDTLDMYVASFMPMDVSSIMDLATATDVATDASGLTAVLVAYDGRASLAFLDCGS